MEQWNHKDVYAAKSADKTALEELVLKAKQGDRDALISLCQTIAKSVLFQMKCILRNPMDAEDASQEVLIRVCSKIHGLKNIKAFNTWLSRIIINESNRYLVENSKRANILNIQDYIETVEEDREDFLPQVCASRESDRKMVMEIIQKLPEQQRKIIILYYYNEMQVTEIAKVMGILQPNVSIQLKRGRNKIKNELQAQDKRLAIMGGAAVIPFNALLSQILQEEAASINEAWVRQMASDCVSHIKKRSGIAEILLNSEPFRKIFIGSTIALVLVISVIVNPWSGDIFQQTAPVVQTETVEGVKGAIEFWIGEARSANVNPERATVWGADTHGALTALHWEIMSFDSERVLYSGYGDTVEEALLEMLARRENGQYILRFVMEDSSGAIYKLSRQFTIQVDGPA